MLEKLVTDKLTVFSQNMNRDFTTVTNDMYGKLNYLDKVIGKMPQTANQPIAAEHNYQLHDPLPGEGPAPQGERSHKLTMRDLPRPDKFSGDDKQDPADFIASLERLYFLADIRNNKDRVGYAATCLIGPALTWINTITSSVMPSETRELIATWDGFQEELIAQFTPVNKTRAARDRLATCKQGEKESVRKYTPRLREIFITLPKVTEDEKLDRFIRNLQPAIRQEIEMTNPDTFEEAAKQAERIDATWFQSRTAYNNENRLNARSRNNNNNNSRMGDRHTHINGRAPMDLGAANMSTKGPRREFTPAEQKLYEQGKCTRCSKKWEKGHKCTPMDSNGKNGTSPKAGTTAGNGPWRQPQK